MNPLKFGPDRVRLVSASSPPCNRQAEIIGKGNEPVGVPGILDEVPVNLGGVPGDLDEVPVNLDRVSDDLGGVPCDLDGIPDDLGGFSLS